MGPTSCVWVFVLKEFNVCIIFYSNVKILYYIQCVYMEELLCHHNLIFYMKYVSTISINFYMPKYMGTKEEVALVSLAFLYDHYVYIYIYIFNHLKMSRITLTFSWTRYVAILLPERCRVWDGSRALIHQADGCLTSRSRKVSKPRDCILKWSNHSDIWHASWQCYYRGAFQISVRLEKSEPESCGIETSRDLTIRRPSA